MSHLYVMGLSSSKRGKLLEGNDLQVPLPTRVLMMINTIRFHGFMSFEFEDDYRLRTYIRNNQEAETSEERCSYASLSVNKESLRR